MAAEKPPSSTPSPSSSSSQPLDQSLVRVFGELESALSNLTAVTTNTHAAVQQVVRIVEELSKLVKERSRGDSKFKELVLDTLGKMTEGFERLAQQEGISTEVVIDARNAIVAAKQQMAENAKAIKDATGPHALLPAEDTDGAPRFLQVIVLHLTNFGWKNKAKVVGWMLIAATSLWNAWERIQAALR